MKFVKDRKGKVVRRMDYNILRMLEIPRSIAIRLRDWSWNHIIIYLEVEGYIK